MLKNSFSYQSKRIIKKKQKKLCIVYFLPIVMTMLNFKIKLQNLISFVRYFLLLIFFQLVIMVKTE